MLRRSWRLLALAFVSAFVAAGASMLYSNHAARESERKWCGVVSTMDDAYRATPPQTPAGRKIAADIRHLRADFDCP
jgi:hypothetical protein